MKHISFLIKPASSTCNMRCRYCFYADVAEHRKTPDHGIMDAATYQAIVDRAFTRVLDAIAALRRAGADFNILTVLTDQLAHHPQKLYRFYKQHKFDFVQLIPCLPGLDKTSDEFSLEPESFASFYKTFFRLWLEDFKRGDHMSVTLFDNVIPPVRRHSSAAVRHVGIVCTPVRCRGQW